MQPYVALFGNSQPGRIAFQQYYMGSLHNFSAKHSPNPTESNISCVSDPLTRLSSSSSHPSKLSDTGRTCPKRPRWCGHCPAPRSLVTTTAAFPEYRMLALRFAVSLVFCGPGSDPFRLTTADNAYVEAQSTGKVASLCDAGSAFRKYIQGCNE